MLRRYVERLYAGSRPATFKTKNSKRRAEVDDWAVTKKARQAPGFADVFRPSTGEVAEWSIAAVLKTAGPQGPGGSNPSLSASFSL